MSLKIKQASLCTALLMPLAFVASCSMSPSQKSEAVGVHDDSVVDYSFWVSEDNHQYAARLNLSSMYDGDTLYIDDHGENTRAGVWGTLASQLGWNDVPNEIRLFGVDTPEIKDNDTGDYTVAAEHKYSILARDFVKNELFPKDGQESVIVEVVPTGLGVYGRMIANVKYIPAKSANTYNVNDVDVQAGWKDLGGALVEAGLARVAYVQDTYTKHLPSSIDTYIEAIHNAQDKAIDTHMNIWSEDESMWFGDGGVFPKAQHLY